MEQVRLGRTGLEVSVAGLGCGGDSHLGLDTGGSIENAKAVVQRAFELGITLFDTADEYGTEELVGEVLAPVRAEVVLCSKTKPLRADGSLLDRAALVDNVRTSLRQLRTDRIDVYYLHMVRPKHYEYCRDELLPALEGLRASGEIGHIAITEGSRSDPRHEMLARAVPDGCWEAVMCAFNPFNSSARRLLFPHTTSHDVGVVVMCAARGPLSHPDELRRVVAELVSSGELSRSQIDEQHPLEFLLDGGATSVIEACYRYARHEPGCDVVLTGTGSTAHLEENVASIGREPLPVADLERLDELFGHLQRMTRD